MSEVKHSPTPWKVENNGSARSVAIVNDQHHIASVWNVGEGHGVKHANAEHIVRCVNAHDALVNALMKYRTNYAMHDSEIKQKGFEMWVEIQNEADKALLLAGIEVHK